MKTILLQLDITWNRPQANIERCCRLMEGQKADLFVLPEMWSTGFITEPEGIAEEEQSSVALAWMEKTARERDCAVCGSLAVRVVDGTYRNRHYFVTPDHLFYYDKHHLFRYGHENEHYTAGETTVIAEWKGMRFLLLTCYDLRFPVWARYGRAGEYDAIICVANWPYKRQDAWDVLTRARAVENQCYVLAVNRVGDDPVGHYQGGSVVVDPIGRVVASCKKDAEQPLSAALSIETLKKRREHFRVLDDRDV